MKLPLRRFRPLLALSLLLSGLLLPGLTAAAFGSQPTVDTTQGSAAGKWIRNGTGKAFLGLPYAAAPVGGLRWKAPQPPAPWKGLRDATRFGARCQQWHIWNDYLFQDAGPSEDCLFLNVYAPAAARPAARLPVMVWIHGGGFAAGSGSEPRYSDPALISRNVIVVTLNYRLGVFGFLANRDLVAEGGGHAGNYGLMDMAAALQWVKRNIAAFGGDPGNVTVFGESAGSFSVNALMASPQAQGLFQKAIGESGAFFGNVIPLSPLAERAALDQKWTDSLGAKTLAELRALPADALIAAAAKQSVARFAPVVDGVFLTEPVATTFAAGRQAHIPTLIGWNRDERTATLSKDITPEKWKDFATQHYGPKAQAFLAVFPATTAAQAVRSADTYTTDAFIGLGTWSWLEAQAHTGRSPVYRYRFDLPSPPSEVHPEGKYAFHSAELEYVFGTLDTRRGAAWRPQDRQLSDAIIAYWTNFARTGDPNAAGLVSWPRYDTTGELLHLDAPIAATPDADRPQLEFLIQDQEMPH